VTPEYPSGIYAYYVTVDAAGASAYPYAIGPTYYGIVQNENITQHQRVTITEQVTTYTPTVPKQETMAPVLPIHLVCGEMTDTLTDLPLDSLRSGLGSLGNDGVGVGFVFKSGRDSTYNFDSTFLPPLSEYMRGQFNTLVHFKVLNLQRPAHGAFHAVDRAGNDTTFYFDYIPDSIVATPGDINFGKVPVGAHRDTTITLRNPTIRAITFSMRFSSQAYEIRTTLPSPFTLNGFDSVAIAIRFKPTFPAGWADSLHVTLSCFSENAISFYGEQPATTVTEMNALMPWETTILSLSPNPGVHGSGVVDIVFTAGSRSSTPVSIVNMLGAEVVQGQQVLREAGVCHASVDVSTLTAGAYMVRVGRAVKMLVIE